MTIHRVIDEEEKRFTSDLVNASTEYSRVETHRLRVYDDWKAGKVICQRDLTRNMEGLPEKSIKHREAILGIPSRSTVNVPYAKGTIVLRSTELNVFSDARVEVLLLIANTLSLAPIFA
ncbi:TPA: hypothetical protein DCE37_18590 [Candidatus Latescibacteria bacterium]|nr:hypothetical protein [Candidatus Latescibacterota bacterium]